MFLHSEHRLQVKKAQDEQKIGDTLPDVNYKEEFLSYSKGESMAGNTGSLRLVLSGARYKRQSGIPTLHAKEHTSGVLESKPTKIWIYDGSAKCFWILVSTQNSQRERETP